jgi:SAM-dependent methyltransferase
LETSKFNTTSYSGISGIYFKHLLKEIVKIGNFKDKNSNVLDFGCGVGLFKRLIKKINPDIKVINYDIKKEYSEVDNWQDENFDVLVANEVFYYLTSEELDKLLLEFKKKNPNLEIIVGSSKQSWVNTLGQILLFQINSHKNTILKPKEELNILTKHLDIIDHKSVWFLADVYRLKYKKE